MASTASVGRVRVRRVGSALVSESEERGGKTVVVIGDDDLSEEVARGGTPSSCGWR